MREFSVKSALQQKALAKEVRKLKMEKTHESFMKLLEDKISEAVAEGFESVDISFKDLEPEIFEKAKPHFENRGYKITMKKKFFWFYSLIHISWK